MMRTLLIREFALSDYPVIERIWRVTGLLFPFFDRKAVYARMMKKAPDLLLVAEVDGRTVGGVVALQRLFIGYLFHLAVHPTYQRRGIGSMLLTELCQRLKSRGVRLALLGIKPQAEKRNDLARFYGRHGFKAVGTMFIKKL